MTQTAKIKRRPKIVPIDVHLVDEHTAVREIPGTNNKTELHSKGAVIAAIFKGRVRKITVSRERGLEELDRLGTEAAA